MSVCQICVRALMWCSGAAMGGGLLLLPYAPLADAVSAIIFGFALFVLAVIYDAAMGKGERA